MATQYFLKVGFSSGVISHRRVIEKSYQKQEKGCQASPFRKTDTFWRKYHKMMELTDSLKN